MLGKDPENRPFFLRLTSGVYCWGAVEAKQFHFRMQRALWPVAVGMLIAGAVIGGYVGLGIILTFMGFTWLVFLFQDRLIHLPHAAPAVEQAVSEQALALGLAPPAVYEFRDTKANASALTSAFGGAAVILNSGFFSLSSDERNAIIAHELVHIKHRDSLTIMALLTAIGVVEVMVAVAVLDRWTIALVGLLPLVSWVLELKADIVGASACGDPPALSRALSRLKGYNWWIAPFLLFWTIFALVSHSMLSLHHLLFVSYALASILPTHPPTLMRRWVLRTVSPAMLSG